MYKKAVIGYHSEQEDIMNDHIDMGAMTSKQIGNLMSKTLIERGKEVAKEQYSNVDYGDLPSKTLTDLGKQSLINDGIIVEQKGKTS